MIVFVLIFGVLFAAALGSLVALIRQRRLVANPSEAAGCWRVGGIVLLSILTILLGLCVLLAVICAQSTSSYRGS